MAEAEERRKKLKHSEPTFLFSERSVIASCESCLLRPRFWSSLFFLFFYIKGGFCQRAEAKHRRHLCLFPLVEAASGNQRNEADLSYLSIR